jgi:hypothetical protein
MFDTWKEDGVYAIWNLHLSKVLRALWGSGQFGAQLAVQGCVPEGEEFKGDPDQVIVMGGKVLVPIEVKHIGALPPGGAPLHHLKLAADKEKKCVEQKHLEQVFGYLASNGKARPRLRL